MRLKKTISFSDKHQVWRLLIDDSDKIFIETRDLNKKEVFFNCFELLNGKNILKSFQLDEKFWIGIETIYKGIIYFHSFAKPNMPEHKKIIAYDINQKKIIWQNDDLIFLTVLDDVVFSFKKKFEGQDTFRLNYRNGEILEDDPNEKLNINEIIRQAELNETFSDYKYPHERTGTDDKLINGIIENELAKTQNVENLELLVYEEFLCFNYYVRNKNNLLDNIFVVYNIDKKKKVVSEILNSNLNSSSPDSFFCYKNNLILIKNKNEIISYKFV